MSDKRVQHKTIRSALAYRRRLWTNRRV